MLRALVFALSWCALFETALIAGGQAEHVVMLEQARAAHRSGHFPKAEALLLQALKKLPSDEKVMRAVMLSELGNVYLNQDEMAKAERAYLDSVAMLRAMKDTATIPLVMSNLGRVYSLEGRHDDAIQTLQQALKSLRANPSADPAFKAHVLNSVGVAYFRQGNNSKAEKFFQEALQIALSPGVRFDITQVFNNLGAVYYAKREFQKAEDLLKQAVVLTEQLVGPSHPELTQTLSTLGLVYVTTGRYREAEELYIRVLRIFEREPSIFDTRIARLLHALNVLYRKDGREAEADAALAQAAAIARRRVAQHSDLALIIENYAASLKSQGKTKEAEELRSEAKRARVAAGLVIHAHSPSIR